MAISLEERKERRRITVKKYYNTHKSQHLIAVYRWRANNIERARENDRAWFRRNPTKMYLKGVRRRTLFPEKVKAAQRNWLINNPERKHAKDHKYRARKYNAPGFDYTTHEHIDGRWKMFGGKCWVCRRPADQTDHVKPLDKGGSHYPGNLRPICLSCNSRKKNRWPIPDYVFTSATPLTPDLPALAGWQTP